jgi:hypothetical protein
MPSQSNGKTSGVGTGDRELFVLAGSLAATNETFAGRTLAEVVCEHLRRAEHQLLRSALKFQGEVTSEQVVNRFSKIQKWYNDHYTSEQPRRRVNLFEDGPGSCVRLSKEGTQLFQQLQAEMQAFEAINKLQIAISTIAKGNQRYKSEAFSNIQNSLLDIATLDEALDFRHSVRENNEQEEKDRDVSAPDQEPKSGNPKTWQEQVKSPKQQPNPNPTPNHDLAAQYEQVYAEMVVERDKMLKTLTERFVPVFNAKVRQKFETDKPVSFEQRTAFAEWIMGQLDGLNLTLFDPEEKRPADFTVIGDKRYKLRPVGSSNGTLSMHFEAFLPFCVCVAGPHKWSHFDRLNGIGEAPVKEKSGKLP